MGFNAKKVNFNVLYGLKSQEGDWFVTRNHIGRDIQLVPLTMAYILLEGKIERSIKGRLDKKGSDESTLSIIGKNGEVRFIKFDSLKPVLFNIENAYKGSIGTISELVFNNTAINSSLSDDILGRKVLSQEYPIFSSYRYGDDNKISEFIVGVIIDVNNGEALPTENGVNRNWLPSEIKNVRVKGWKFDKNSCNEENISLIGNMSTAQEYDVYLSGQVEKLNENPDVKVEIEKFNGNPIAYFKSVKTSRMN